MSKMADKTIAAIEETAGSVKSMAQLHQFIYSCRVQIIKFSVFSDRCNMTFMDTLVNNFHLLFMVSCILPSRSKAEFQEAT